MAFTLKTLSLFLVLFNHYECVPQGASPGSGLNLGSFSEIPDFFNDITIQKILEQATQQGSGAASKSPRQLAAELGKILQQVFDSMKVSTGTCEYVVQAITQSRKRIEQLLDGAQNSAVKSAGDQFLKFLSQTIDQTPQCTSDMLIKLITKWLKQAPNSRFKIKGDKICGDDISSNLIELLPQPQSGVASYVDDPVSQIVQKLLLKVLSDAKVNVTVSLPDLANKYGSDLKNGISPYLLGNIGALIPGIQSQ